MTLDEIRAEAAAVAREMQSGTLTPETRRRLIEIRAALFRRGVFDPVLARFDSATVARASLEEVARQLAAVAENLRL